MAKKAKKVNKVTETENQRHIRSSELRRIMDYDRDFSFLFSGVEDAKYFTWAKKAGAENFLISYERVMVRGEDTALETHKKSGCKFFVDSGAFTYITNPTYAERNVDYWEMQIKNYLSWVERNLEMIFAIANLDIEDLVGVEQVREWNRKYFEPFMLEHQIPVCFIWHPIDEDEGWDFYCKRYPYVGFSMATASAGRGEMLNYCNAKLKVAEKYDTLVHGMGITRTTLLPQLPFFSTDSISWKAGLTYHNITVWDGKYIRQCTLDEWDSHVVPAVSKYERTFRLRDLQEYKERTVVESSIYAYLLAEDYIRHALRPHTYWKRPRVIHNDFEDPDIYPPFDWLLGDDDFPKYRDYAKMLNINPDGRRDVVIEHIKNACLFTHWYEPEYRNSRNAMTEGRVEMLHDEYVNIVRYGTGERIEDLIRFWTEVVEGDTDKMLLSGTVFARKPKERVFDEEEEPETQLVDVSEEEAKEKLKEVMALVPQDDVDLDDLGDQELIDAGLVRHRDPLTGQFTQLQKAVRKNKELYTKRMPKLACNNCNLGAARCPDYQEGSVCAYQKAFRQFDSRNPDDIEDAIQSMMSINIARMQAALVAENLGGGLPTNTVSNLMDQNMRLMKNYQDLKNAQNIISRTLTHNPDGTVTDSTKLQSSSGGILAALFEKGLKRSAEEEKAEKAKKKQEAIEIEGEVIDEDEAVEVDLG